MTLKAGTPTPSDALLMKRPPTTSEHIQSVIVTAALQAQESVEPPNDYLAHLPPLNAQVSAKNFVRFASRCGFMFSFRDAVLLLLSWDKPLDTVVAMVVYGMVCMDPRWLLLGPHAILLTILLSNYQKKKSRLQHPLKTVKEGSPEYLKNMMNLQNMMGEVSDVYDAVAANAHWVDWSDEQASLRILQATLGSGLAIALAVWFVLPLHLVALFAGWAVFLSNTRLAKYVWRELGPDAIALGEHKVKEAGAWYSATAATSSSSSSLHEDTLKVVSLYENQRWWDTTGFAPQMLKGERNPWSDLSGSSQLQPKEELPAPAGYQWSQDNWQLDTTGPWIDETLGIEFLVSPEDGGWVYTDNHWEYTGKNTIRDRQARLTRRRRWIRQCARVPID